MTCQHDDLECRISQLEFAIAALQDTRRTAISNAFPDMWDEFHDLLEDVLPLPAVATGPAMPVTYSAGRAFLFVTSVGGKMVVRWVDPGGRLYDSATDTINPTINPVPYDPDNPQAQQPTIILAGFNSPEATTDVFSQMERFLQMEDSPLLANLGGDLWDGQDSASAPNNPIWSYINSAIEETLQQMMTGEGGNNPFQTAISESFQREEVQQALSSEIIKAISSEEFKQNEGLLSQLAATLVDIINLSLTEDESGSLIKERLATGLILSITNPESELGQTLLGDLSSALIDSLTHQENQATLAQLVGGILSQTDPEVLRSFLVQAITQNPDTGQVIQEIINTALFEGTDEEKSPLQRALDALDYLVYGHEGQGGLYNELTVLVRGGQNGEDGLLNEAKSAIGRDLANALQKISEGVAQALHALQAAMPSGGGSAPEGGGSSPTGLSSSASEPIDIFKGQPGQRAYSSPYSNIRSRMTE